VKLITYLPISRVEDIGDYQYDNIKLLRPRELVVFIDNVNNLEGLEDMVYEAVRDSVDVKVIPVNVGNRSETLLMALSIAERGDVIVDSDVILDSKFPHFLEIVKAMSDNDTQLIGIADANERPGPRDTTMTIKIGDDEYAVNATRIVYNKRGHSPVFFGPKQAIIVNHTPNKPVIDALMDGLSNVPRQIRQCIADETILGLYALMIGQRLTPWFPVAYNALASGGSDACNRHIRAYAHYLLFKAIHINGLPKFIKTRYFISALIHW